MELNITKFITACAIAAMCSSCTVHTRVVATTPQPKPVYHYHTNRPHQPAPGTRYYPIDQLRKGPQAPHHHQPVGPQKPPQHQQPSQPQKPVNSTVRDAERNPVRSSGQTTKPNNSRPQEVKKGNATTRSSNSSATPANTSSSNNSGNTTVKRNGGNR